MREDLIKISRAVHFGPKQAAHDDGVELQQEREASSDPTRDPFSSHKMNKKYEFVENIKNKN